MWFWMLRASAAASVRPERRTREKTQVTRDACHGRANERPARMAVGRERSFLYFFWISFLFQLIFLGFFNYQKKVV